LICLTVESLLTLNGTLIAYSSANDIRKFREEAGLVSQVWKKYLEQNQQPSKLNDQMERPPVVVADLRPGDLHALTMRLPDGVILVRAVQSRLLMVLVGGIPPAAKNSMADIEAPVPTSEISDPWAVPEHVGQPRFPKTSLNYPDTMDFSTSGLSGDHEEAGNGEQEANSSSSDATGSTGITPTPSRDPAVPAVSSTSEVDQATWALNVQRTKLDKLVDRIREELKDKGQIVDDIGE
jgi:hypothetical protein